MRFGGLDKFLLFITVFLLLWFFASSLGTAFQRAPQRDDAMFVTVPKNFLNGYGWATSYGEKIPFNPDLTAGPALLLPAAALIAAFDTQTWTAAVTGTLLSIAFSVLILWQLFQLTRNPIAHAFGFLASLSLFAVHDFKSFSGYYPCALLFIWSLLLVINKRYRPTTRLLAYGLLAGVGVLAKPLVFGSFLLAMPWVVWRLSQDVKGPGYFRPLLLSGAMITLGFALVLAPWLFYKHHVLSGYDPAFQQAHRHYTEHFFEHHGTGIAQLEAAHNPLLHLESNAKKNFRILRNFITREYSSSIWALGALLVITLCLSGRRILMPAGKFGAEEEFMLPLSLVIVGNLLWYIFLSFAMTPGHAFFAAYFSFFLLFFFLCSRVRSALAGILLCSLAAATFTVRHPPLVNAYQFKSNDLYITNQDIREAMRFLNTHPAAHPLAACGYQGGPWRLEFLMPASENFVDCYNVMEDALEQDSTTAKFYWRELPSFTLVLETFGAIMAAESQSYVLQPLIEACEKKILFRNQAYVVCEVHLQEIVHRLNPDETARQLSEYQHWYRTRLKPGPGF